MTRSLYLLIGGLLLVSALGLLAIRSDDVDNVVSLTSTRSGRTPAGVFVPNLGSESVDAYFFLQNDRSKLLLYPNGLHIQSQVFEDALLEASLFFIGANKFPKLTGHNPISSATGFRTVRYYDVYDGIDFELSSSGNGLTGRFELDPGADPNLIHMKTANPAGELLGGIAAYQEIDGQRIELNAEFVVSRYESMRLEIDFRDPGASVVVEFDLVTG
jgi:hypothetical protein